MREKPDFDQCASGSAVIWIKGPFGAALIENVSQGALAASVYLSVRVKSARPSNPVPTRHSYVAISRLSKSMMIV